MKTSNYTQFSFKATNRSISRKKVNGLKKVIEKFGYDENQPIQVLEDFKIHDGQHRFTACMELGIDINYEFAKIKSDEHMRAINSIATGWELTDFIESYAKEGRKTYVDFSNFMKYHKIKLTSGRIIYSLNTTQDIRDGKDIRKNPNADKIMEVLHLFSKLDFAYKKSFVLAIASLMAKNPTDEQIKRLVKYKMALEEMANTSQYLKVFEDLINRHIKTNKIWLR